jgi:GABA permease
VVFVNRYLVVANQTLGGEPLLARLRSLIPEGPAQFHVLVPATPPRHQWTWTEGEANAIAQKRLDEAMERFRALGAEVTGEVGTASPIDAIANVLREREIDVIVLSTLPPGPSRWLKQDLPHRVERVFSRPVVHVVGEAERAAS